MNKFLDKIKDVDEYAESVSDAGGTILAHWRNFATFFTAFIFICVSGIGLYTLYEGRGALGKLAYNAITAGAKDAPRLLNEWSLVPVEDFPEFWICQHGGCIINESKRNKVIEELDRLRGETGAVRTVFSVYGSTHRRVAAQSVALGEESLKEELWLLSIRQDGYNQSVINHQRGICNEIIIDELVEGSTLRVEAAVYNTSYLKNCPVNENDIPYQVKGYVSLDLSELPDEADKPVLELRLKQAAEKIEQIMGYD